MAKVNMEMAVELDVKIDGMTDEEVEELLASHEGIRGFVQSFEEFKGTEIRRDMITCTVEDVEMTLV